MWSGGPVQFCHPSWVVSLVLQSLIGAQWSSSGHTKCVFLILNALFVLASALAGRFGYSMLCPLVALFPGAGVGCPLLSSRALRRRLRPLPCSSVGGLHCTGPTNARQSQWETVVSCAGGQVFPGTLRLRIVSDASGSFLAAGCSMKELSKTTGSRCRCHRCAGSRSRNSLFCVT